MTADGAVITVLLIDDNPDDRALVVHALRAEFPALRVEQVVSAADFEVALDVAGFDVVITDFALRWSDGLAVLAAVRARHPAVPVIMFTGTGTQEVAVQAMKGGLTDYVVKSPRHFGRLPVTVKQALDNRRQAAALEAAEARLHHSQKLEALGQLSAVIAHDFNNALTAIRGSAEMLLDQVPTTGPAVEDVHAIISATDDAIGLARQLLSFSRRADASPALLDLGWQVEAMAPVLRRLVGRRVELQVDRDGTEHLVVADRGQIDQVLVNLAMNARDAMPSGGRLDIAVGRSDGRPADAVGPETTHDRFVRVAVRDTGTGMDPATRARAFEPFFTTKPAGRGTGLGLASVYGIVTGAGGVLRLVSAPGAGTCVEVLWPVATASAT